MITNGTRFIPLSDELIQYVDDSRTKIDQDLLTELRQATAQFGEDAIMQIPDYQGTFLTLLTKLVGARKAIEFGTFTGHSSICIARGLPKDGKLICLDMNKEWTDVALEFWRKADLSDRIELHLGDARETVKGLTETDFDLVHIDAEKTLYEEFYEAALPLVRSGGVFVFDNMLRGGRIVDQELDERTAAIKKLNAKLANDPRVETVMLTVGDGIQLCRKV